MRNLFAPPKRHIWCRMDGGTVVVNLSTDDEPTKLYLTRREARSLVSNLDEELRRWLFLVMEEPPVPDVITVLDVSLTTDDASMLRDSLENLLNHSSDDLGEEEVGDNPEDVDQPDAAEGKLSDHVDWMTEGF